jgi:hypothetical protein
MSWIFCCNRCLEYNNIMFYMQYLIYGIVVAYSSLDKNNQINPRRDERTGG